VEVGTLHSEPFTEKLMMLQKDILLCYISGLNVTKFAI